jgi:cyclopropane fatty-acyl-phospholipid synthase-like methyltransferase
MKVTMDPEGNEIKALLEYAENLAGKRVLEIGAGYGRLTWRYAAHTRVVVGIDPNPEKIARARQEVPQELRGRVTLLETTLADYRPDAQAVPFDVALMSWAL